MLATAFLPLVFVFRMNRVVRLHALDSQVSRQGCVPARTLGTEEMLKDCYRQWIQPGGKSHLAGTVQFVLNDRLCPEVFGGSFVSIEPSLISASAFHSRR